MLVLQCKYKQRKIKMNIKTIITIIVIILGVLLFNKYQDTARANYALNNNCTWTVYGSHDICK